MIQSSKQLAKEHSHLRPSNITHIKKSAFYACDNLQSINIDPNSKIEIIEQKVFSSTLIDRIRIPSNVTRIENEAFFNCLNLQIVEFPSDSKLQIIEDNAFFQSAIMSIEIPPNVTQIGVGAFGRCDELQIIEFDENSQIEYIHQNMFYDTDYDNNDDYIYIVSKGHYPTDDEI